MKCGTCFSLVETGSEMLSKGLNKGAILTSEAMRLGAVQLKQYLQPELEPLSVDPMVKQGLAILRAATGAVGYVSEVFRIYSPLACSYNYFRWLSKCTDSVRGEWGKHCDAPRAGEAREAGGDERGAGKLRRNLESRNFSIQFILCGPFIRAL